MSQPLINIQYSRIHFVGIAGIGMSALAQMLALTGIKVTGSDRDINKPENDDIFQALKSHGIDLFPQDGSFCNIRKPDIIVYSTAIEKDNKDFIAAPEIPKIHRAEMLAQIIDFQFNQEKKHTIAICGSCGKTTVTAWLSETLYHLKNDPTMIGGGYSNIFKSKKQLGNFFAGKGTCTVFEADESDKSLLKYHPNYAIITNIGTDHYPKKELKILFRKFLKHVKKAVIVSADVFLFLGEDSFNHLKVEVFSEYGASNLEHIPKTIKKWLYTDYAPNSKGINLTIHTPNDENFKLQIPAYGRHSALNALAVLAASVSIFQNDSLAAINALQNFKGVYRRFTFKGINDNGALIYDDYAHNVEKIISCINSAQEISNGNNLIILFQPHGFTPLKFMKDKLFEELEKNLRDDDIFAFLPVFYAGGTANFSPTSDEVSKQYSSKGSKKYLYFKSREYAELYIEVNSKKGDIIIICGARDNSLPFFAQKLT